LTLVAVIAAGFWIREVAARGSNARTVRRAFAAGQLSEASGALERWLSSSPDSAEAHYYKARIAWVQDDLPTVDQELTRAAALGHDWQAVARLRGLLLARGNDSSEAEPLLHRALDGSRFTDTEVADALTRLYLGTFRLREAGMVLERWRKERPSDARPYLLQTEVDRRTDAPVGIIIRRYRDALERDPGLDRARLGLAEYLRANQQLAEAASQYATYVTNRPEDPKGYLGAGETALEMNDLAKADQLLERAVSLAPRDPVVLTARATLELRSGHLVPALRLFDRAVSVDPFDQWTRYQRMLTLSRLGKRVEASAELKAIERLKQDRAQFDQITHELVRKPLDSRLRSEAARWLMDHGHEDEAVEWANLVLRSDPSHSAMNRLLADYYRKKGQLGLANFHEMHAAREAGHAAAVQ
jgi:tetratricopeptide (TPR) repeat protein